MLLWDASINFVDSVDVGVISPAYETLRPKSAEVDQNYFSNLLKIHWFREQYKYISQGTNVRRRKAPVEAFLDLQFEYSTNTTERRKISEFLAACSEEIEAQSSLLEALQAQKRALMQRLLTGQVRVSTENV